MKYQTKWICLECEKEIHKDKINEIGKCPSCGNKIFEVEILEKKMNPNESTSKTKIKLTQWGELIADSFQLPKEEEKMIKEIINQQPENKEKKYEL